MQNVDWMWCGMWCGVSEREGKSSIFNSYISFISLAFFGEIAYLEQAF